MTETILITGAASGIGRATAQRMHALGYAVALADISIINAHEFAEELGSRARAFEMDVTNEGSVEDGFREAIEWSGGIDALFANAGVSNMKRAVDLSLDDWNFNFDVNAKGIFLTNREVLRHFIATKRKGVIVNTASLAAKVGAPLLAHYSASKFAVLGWTQALAREHGKDGIRVNAVCPGFVETPMQDREVVWEAELLDDTPDGVRRSYIDQTPLGRLASCEDVAGVVAFLVSDAARFMTGQGVNVTGGVYMG